MTEGAPPARWSEGELPANVRAGAGTVITGKDAFRRFRSRRPLALHLGERCTMDGVGFAVGEEGELRIGERCYFTCAVLLCELRVEIGCYVSIGWNVTIADSDFHPLEPAARIADAIACSPAGKGLPRPPAVCKPIVIEDYVWIGPSATILKGVRLGQGCVVEPGALVTRDVPARARVLGNPAQIVGEV
jgi:acetyltransferase-like isoleucine patch superfamily enzyme